MSDTTHYTLDNGLTVLLKEMHSAPVISFWVVYNIGSRNEKTGQTGISHWVEHMMFKGTEKFPAGTLDRAVDRVGGQWNAMTSYDYTMYYQTLPADQIDLAIESEADRMMNTIFESEETESERTVIISERQGSENNPMFWLREEVRATAFRIHGYHHPIIGDMDDLRTMTRDDLHNHYKKHYVPSNATVVVVGAFDTEDMLARVKKNFGNLPTLPKPELFNRAEPEQQGERRLTVERPGQTAFLLLAHRVPAANHEDWFKLEVLSSVLSGPDGGISNKTSRLYQALVKTEVALQVGGGLQSSIDPSLYNLTVVLRDGCNPQDAEQIILDEISKIQQNGITADELAKAKKQARASFAYGTESMSNQAYYLAQSAILGDYKWFDQYIEKLEAVTLDDIQQVANKYLTARNRNVGYLIPTGIGG